MDSLIAFGVIVLLSATTWHYTVKNYGGAVLGSTLTIVLLFQLAVILSVGYFDPFFSFAMLALAGLSTVISAVIGIPFVLSRRKKVNFKN